MCPRDGRNVFDFYLLSDLITGKFIELQFVAAASPTLNATELLPTRDENRAAIETAKCCTECSKDRENHLNFSDIFGLIVARVHKIKAMQ